jgi:hypothetical protein
MKRFLKSVVSMIRGSGKRPVSRAPQARLQVEGLEERVALSTVTSGVVDPLTPVYGYKHRRRWPYAITSSSPTVAIEMARGRAAPTTASLSVPASAAHLIAGGTGGVTVVAAGGQIHVTPPTGPLPIG